jgi:ABC-2 type transport system ATP-binding protein
MYRGRVIALGTPADLREGLSTHTLLQLETSAPLETMRALEHVPGVGDVAVFGGGLHVSVHEPESATEAIRSRLAAKGIDIHKLETILPSLEDVFVALIEAEEKNIA